jgi:hypothetical protein
MNLDLQLIPLPKYQEIQRYHVNDTAASYDDGIYVEGDKFGGNAEDIGMAELGGYRKIWRRRTQYAANTNTMRTNGRAHA